MAKKKFRSAAQARRFQSIGNRLQASRGEIEADTRRRTEALELQQRQLTEQAKNQYSGMVNAAEFEEKVLKEKNQLESKVRKHKLDAVKVRRDTHVKALVDEAKHKAGVAKDLATLAPKQAKAAQKMFEGVQTLGDTMYGINQWKHAKESGFLDTLIDGKADAHYNIVWDATNDTYKLSQEGNSDLANGLQDKSIRLSSHWAKKKFVSWVKENKELLKADVIANLEKKDENGDIKGIKYGENNAIQTQEFGALGLLKTLGISNNTKIGAEIVDQFSSWGSLDRKGFYEGRMVQESEERIDHLTSIYNSADVGSGEKDIAFKNLVLGFKNGHFKQYGRYLNPNGGTGLYSTMKDAYVQAGKHVMDKGINDGTITIDNVSTVLDKYTEFPGEKLTEQQKQDGVKLKTWSSRFPDAYQEEVIDYAIEQIAKKNTQDKKVQELRGVAFVADFKAKKLVEIKKDSMITNTEVAETIDLMAKRNIRPKEAALVMRELGYFKNDFEINGHLANIVRAGEAGDYDEVWRIWTSTEGKLTQDEKTFLKENVYYYQKLKEANPDLIVLRNQIAAESIKDFGLSGAIGEGKKLSEQGKQVVKVKMGLYLAEFRRLADLQLRQEERERVGGRPKDVLDTGGGKEIGEKAKAYITDLWNDAKKLKNPNDEMEGNRFDWYKPADGGPLIFPYLNNYRDAQVDTQKLSVEQKEKKINHELYNNNTTVALNELHIKQWSDNYEERGLKTLAGGTDAVMFVLDHDNVASGPQLAALDLYAKKINTQDVYGDDTFIPKIKAVEALWEFMPDIDGKKVFTKVQMYNYLLEKHGSEYRLTEDYAGQLSQQETEGGLSLTDRNTFAYSVWTSNIAQRVYPKGIPTATYLEGGSKEESFLATLSAFHPEEDPNDFQTQLKEGGLFHTGETMEKYPQMQRTMLALSKINWYRNAVRAGRTELPPNFGPKPPELRRTELPPNFGPKPPELHRGN